MPFQKITIRPGVNTMATQTLNEGGWSATNLIRFRDGFLERLRGWQKLFTTACAGYVRGMHTYEDLTLQNNLMLGTDEGPQIYADDVLEDVDFAADTSNIAGSAVVGAETALLNIVFAGSLFFVSSEADPYTIYTSSNGTSWTPTTYAQSMLFYKTIRWDGAKYILLTYTTSQIYTSTNGITWTLQGSIASTVNNPVAMTSGGGVFVAINYQGKVASSTDGLTWTSRTPANTSGWTAIAYGGSFVSRFIAVTNTQISGSQYVMTSEDGITWTGRDAIPGAWSAIAFDGVGGGASRFVAVSQSGGVNGAMFTLDDGETWTQAASAPYGVWNDVVFGNGLFVAVGTYVSSSTAFLVMTSTDGNTWTGRSATANNSWRSIAYKSSGTRFVSVSPTGSNRMMTSTNGTSWSVQSYGDTTTVSVTDSSYSPATGSQIRIPVEVAIGGDILNPATYTVTRTSSTTYTFPIPYTIASAVTSTVARFVIGAPQVGTTSVTVYLTAHGQTVGSFFDVQIDTPLDDADVTLNGSYEVTSVIDANTFIINSGQASAAVNTATHSNGNYIGVENYTGTVPIWYLESNDPTNQSVWSLDNLGNTGLFSFTDGALFAWTPPVSQENVAVNVSTASQINTGMLVAMPQAQVITYGSESVIDGGDQDPLLVRFSDAGGYTNWTASATNQAGSYRLSRGSRIIGAIQAPQTTLLWTDIDIWAMQYVGPPIVYSFSVVGTGCGLISQNARVTVGTTTFWMGTQAFWAYNGQTVSVIPCAVWDNVFNDLDTANSYKIWAWANSALQEVWFFYPSLSGATGEIDSYVKFKVDGGMWDYGSLVRTAGIDQSVFGTPLAADEDFHIQQHEIGYDADGEAMTGAYAETGFFDIGDGDEMMFIDQLIPDFKWLGENGSVSVTLKWKNYPSDVVQFTGPYAVTPQTQIMPLRARARQIAIRLDWAAIEGYSARLGACRYRGAQAGRRP